VQLWVGLITTLLDVKDAVKRTSQNPAGNSIVSDELLTTVDNISNMLPFFTFTGNG
jgi:hypothetical protein